MSTSCSVRETDTAKNVGCVKSAYLDVLERKYKGENRLLNKIGVLWGKHGRLEPPAGQCQRKEIIKCSLYIIKGKQDLLHHCAFSRQ
jgi:hypothetical protein